MLPSFLICLRESIELGFVIALCFAVIDRGSEKRIWILGGAVLGLIMAGALAVMVIMLHASWAETGEDLFGAILLTVATCALLAFRAWRVRNGDAFVLDLHGQGRATAHDGKMLGSLVLVIAAAVFREGSETVLFLYGVLSSTTDTLLGVTFGLVLGVSFGASTTYLIYKSVTALPIRAVMGSANMLLILFSAGMAARTIEILEEQGLLTSDVLWSTTSLLPRDAFLGHVLQCVIGYSDKPTFNQVAVYLLVLILQFCISLIPKRRHAAYESYRASLSARETPTRSAPK